MTTSDSFAYHWKSFLLNKFAAAGVFLIAITSPVAILSYLIAPDDTPQANNMLVQLSLKNPCASFTLLRLQKQDHANTVNLFQKMFFGQPSAWRDIPITSFRFNRDSLYVRGYIGEENVAAETAYNIYKIRAVQPYPSYLNTKKKVLKEASVQAVRKGIASHRIIKKTYWLGTDLYGHNILSRLIIGAPILLAVGFVSVIISLIVGITAGSAAGYYGGKTDGLLSWLMNVSWALPSLLLEIAISFALGKRLWQIVVAVRLLMWVKVGRLVRGQVIALKQIGFVESARASGFGNYRIISPVLVLAASNFASAILLEAGLSFMGYGAQPPSPMWGAMIKEYYGNIIINSAYLAILPGLAIMLMVYAFNVVTIGLRSAFDVKSQNVSV